MSSVISAKSQISALKTYITTGTVALLNELGTSASLSVSTGVALRDMGRTVFLADGGVLRKVETLPRSAVEVILTGYISLGGGESAPTVNIVRLN